MSDQPNYYAILDITPDATLTEIKKAFRRLARLYHPDLNPNNLLAKIKFQEASAAYEVLSDPNKRSQYDQQINEQKTADQAPSLTARNYYVKGVQKYLIRHYQEAIDYFNQAIALKPDFAEAYLQRCEIYFDLQAYPEVLEDCYQILQLNPQVWQAYYYQGVVRKKLGYLESAIEAYNQGILLNPQEPRTYYKRGLAYQELNQNKSALKDFYQASDLYFKQGRMKGYYSVQHQIKKNRSLDKFLEITGLANSRNLINITILMIFQILLNPSGEILPKFSKLKDYQKLVIGCLYGLIAELIITFILPQYQFLGLLTFGSLIVWMILINFNYYPKFKALATVFVAGLFSLSLSFILVAWSFLNILPFGLVVSLMMSLGASSFLILYCSFTQIFNFSEQQSTYLMPLTCLLLLYLFTLFFN